MTTTYVAVQMVVNGKPFVFSVDATDGTANEELTNIVSGLGLGDTFSSGGKITSLMPATLNSSDGTGASKSVVGVEIVDPQNNVITFIPWVDPETGPIGGPWVCNFPVGLNYKMQVTTSNT